MDCLFCTLRVLRARLAFTLIAEWVRGLCHEVLVNVKRLFQVTIAQQMGSGDRSEWRDGRGRKSSSPLTSSTRVQIGPSLPVLSVRLARDATSNAIAALFS
jgi:hypothetical protein